MGRRHHYRRNKETPELDVTTFLNLMVVLIPFLLVTAVFSRITIQELNMPESAAGGSEVDKPLITIEVIIREEAIEIGDGKSVTLSIPKVDGEYDIAELSDFLMKLKAQYEEKEDATVLVEPDIAYEDLIRVMDAVKVAELPGEPGEGDSEDEEAVQHMVLFPAISIGDAP